MANTNYITEEGVVTEALGNGMFTVHLDSDRDILTYVSGKLRYRRIRIDVGDRVKVEYSPYDKNRGRIIYRNRGIGIDIDE
uniref:Translation initiation factor IF-1, chloroplastic n=2 Tax=Taxus TaxID=25628 RepID=A0A481XF88_9CONI|nr:translation initiation factor 1 [Taxus globosa]YP_009579002.1 translation initiation factor 1 [Taxus floridana]QBK33608.1 translation initiation factor 1 [Taxus globosa]QBK35002.1 translation initiation factor 1 [Taxus globosa]QBK35084.1 translation initiation factor 1 [Taxus floridana]QBK35576.1 translation initiation factor 1 [Taxus floridana]QBK36068.1 translation initiation factor 1 [Taxus floridana]